MSSYPQYSDTEHKERWLRKIQADIEFKKQNEALDKIKNINEERTFLDNLRAKDAEFAKRNNLGKMNYINNKYDNLQYSFERRKNNELSKLTEKLKEKEMIGLDFKSEERLNQYKMYIQKLEEKVDKNFENSKNYLYNHVPNNPMNKSKILNEVNKISNNLNMPCNTLSNSYDTRNLKNIVKNHNSYSKDKLKSDSGISPIESMKNIEKGNENIQNNLRKEKTEQQIYYRYLLDNQIRVNTMIKDIQRNKSMIDISKNIPEHRKLMTNNPIINNITSGNLKKYDLGSSSLEINPILNHNSNYNSKLFKPQLQENAINILKTNNNIII